MEKGGQFKTKEELVKVAAGGWRCRKHCPCGDVSGSANKLLLSPDFPCGDLGALGWAAEPEWMAIITF